MIYQMNDLSVLSLQSFSRFISFTFFFLATNLLLFQHICIKIKSTIVACKSPFFHTNLLWKHFMFNRMQVVRSFNITKGCRKFMILLIKCINPFSFIWNVKNWKRKISEEENNAFEFIIFGSDFCFVIKLYRTIVNNCNSICFSAGI